jgi:hypothetical protein
MPKRRVSWVSLISLFVLPLAIVDALRLLLSRALKNKNKTFASFFAWKKENGGSGALGL